ncbi:lasso peptide biosynthesis B2 protein [Nonomuraea sp. LPB2021202275-12-8]|uniref:lasso peptide biosynthesis B2 protein n=1 Tax=Nonomuraea sp. LPB2021202275-12-8 TaxID=3120159 RepID=UPI00300CC3E0
MLELQIPGHVHHRSQAHGGVVLLNATTGTWHALNATAGILWESWANGADFEQSLTDVACRHPAVPLEVVRADANELLRDLMSRGLIVTRRPVAAVMALGTARSVARPPRRARLLAATSLLLAVVLLKLPFRVTTWLLSAIRHWCRGEPSRAAAEAAVSAAHYAAEHYPGRAACLEASLAAVLFAACSRSRLDWCLGAIADPYRFHAWVELGGRPVVPDAEPDAGYLRVISL